MELVNCLASSACQLRRCKAQNAWINPVAVVGLPLQKTFSATWVESFVRLLEVHNAKANTDDMRA